MDFRKEIFMVKKEEDVFDNKLVIINRCFNEQDFTSLTSKELDILFSLLYLARWRSYTEGTRIKNLKTLANIKRTDLNTLERQFNNVRDFLNDGKFGIFKNLRFDKERRTFSYELNRDKKYLFDKENAVSRKEYLIIFNLDIFTKIKSKYEKNIYRILVVYSGNGWLKINRNQFLKAIGFPKSYNKRQETYKLKECLKNLDYLFPGIEIDEVKGVIREDDYFYIKWNNQKMRKINKLDC